jgi:antitoxin CptB
MDQGAERSVRLRRLRIRSWRRGTREMDLILGRFADTRLAALGPEALELYEALLAEPDLDLYAWIVGRAPPPRRYAALLSEIARAATG